MKDFAEIIVQRRKALGISMDKGARLADVTLGTMRNLERGRPVNVNTLCAVCRALGLELVIQDKS